MSDLTHGQLLMSYNTEFIGNEQKNKTNLKRQNLLLWITSSNVAASMDGSGVMLVPITLLGCQVTGEGRRCHGLCQP